MTRPAWRVRAGLARDRKLLARFRCASTGDHWDVEVEQFIQGHLMDWVFAPLAASNDPRLLLLFERGKPRDVIGVAAHERCVLQGPGGQQFPARRLQVAALSVAWQGRRFAGDERASDVLLSAAMTDIQARVPGPDVRVMAIVHEKNPRSLALCRRFGLTEEISRPGDDEYRRFLTRAG